MRESRVERAILVDLHVNGHDQASNISRRTGHPPSSISRSLSNLADEGVIVNKGGGVYRLTEAAQQEAIGLLMSGFNPFIHDDNGSDTEPDDEG